MNFSINFVERVTAVLKEAIQLKKYKAMPLYFAIPTGIFLLPVALIAAGLSALIYVLGYLFSVVLLPIESLYKLLHDEGQKVKHGTQIVVYLLSWGFVFGAYVALTAFLVTLTVLYTLFSIFTYLWTLGGIRFHLFANEENFVVEVEGKYNDLVPIIFIAIMAALLIAVPMITSVAALIEHKPDITLELLVNLFKVKMHETDNLRFAVSVLYSAIVFANGPKKTEE